MSEAATPTPPPAPGQRLHAFEAILRMCARSAPEPWYPRLYAQSVGMAPDALYAHLEELWLDGLVRKASGPPESGPGLTLTEAGRDLLDDPAALQRLKEGRAVKPGDQGGAVREAFRRRTRPIATLGVIAVNAAAFLYTVYLASRLGIVSDFIALSPFGEANPVVAQRVQNVIIQAGAVYGGGWLNGEWWLLLTSCFIHIGAMHILANMYALYRVGGEVERMWGSVRYLVIYLFAGLGGSCLALGLAPREVMAGASGAICGVLGAEAVWVLCNGRHLPRSLARELRRNLLINGVLITFISLMPGVSWQGHLGGAVIGAVVALVMQVQRFGPAPLRWVVLFALVPLPWLGYGLIEYERATNPHWAPIHRLPADVPR
jgi:rhomboid protease GluP